MFLQWRMSKWNEFLSLNLQDHLDETAKLEWEIVSTERQILINEHSPATPHTPPRNW